MAQTLKPRLHDGKFGAAITVKVTPKSSRDEISGILEDGTVKIKLTAPPVDGKANEALVKFLSDVLKIPRSKIEIIAGQTGRNKLVSIVGLDAETVQARILQAMTA